MIIYDAPSGTDLIVCSDTSTYSPIFYSNYPKGYYQDNDFVLPTSSQTAIGRFVSTNKTVGTVKLRLSPREM